MKKYLLLVLLFLFPFGVYAEECDSTKVKIKSIDLESKTESTEILEEATVEDMNVNLNVKFQGVGDEVVYNILVENESNDDFELTKDNLVDESLYMKYELKTEDDSYIVKAQSEKNVQLKVSYDKEIEEEKFVDGSFQEEKVFRISLANETKNTTTNPTTLKNIYIIIFALLLVVLLLFTAIHNQKIKNKTMILILGFSLIIPLGVKALCTYDIQVNSHIEVEQAKVCLISGSAACHGLFYYGSTLTYYTIDEVKRMNQSMDSMFSSNVFSSNMRFINREDFACYEEAYNQYQESQNSTEYYNKTQLCPVSWSEALYQVSFDPNQELLTSDKGCYVGLMNSYC